MAFDTVNEENVYLCVGQPTPSQMKVLLQILLNNTFANCCSSKQI